MVLNTINNSSGGKLKTEFLNGSVIVDLDDNDSNAESELYNMIGSLILLLSCVMTILFNGSLLFCMLKNKKKQWMRNAQQIFYLILSDFIVGFLLLPRTATIFIRMSGLPFSMCATFSYILSTTNSVSFYHIMAVCIHRCRMAIRIHVPFDVDRYNYGRESLVIWVGVLLAFVPPYIFWGRHGEILYKCRFESVFGSSDAGAQIYMLVLYVIPWITTNVLYIFVVFKVKKSLQRVHVINNDSKASAHPVSFTSQTEKANKKILRTVGFLLLVFNASIMVSMSVVLGELFKTVIPHIIQPVIFANKLFHPFIYMSASSTLKKETGRVVCEIISSFRCKMPWNKHASQNG